MDKSLPAVVMAAALGLNVTSAFGGQIVIKSSEVQPGTLNRLIMLPDGDLFHLSRIRQATLGKRINPDATLVFDTRLNTLSVVPNANPSDVIDQSAGEVRIYDQVGRYFFTGLSGFPYSNEALDGGSRFSYQGGSIVQYANYQQTTTPFELDDDADLVPNAFDNCLFFPNGPLDTAVSQNDADADGFGNRCDADLNSDCIVNVIDLGLLRSAFFTTDANADLNSDGIVNVVDLGLLRSLFFMPPGPTAIEDNVCDPSVEPLYVTVAYQTSGG
ncbi:MAG: hypothetical protein AB8G17_20575, partial [Gammaproteobacteria bacterium]